MIRPLDPTVHDFHPLTIPYVGARGTMPDLVEPLLSIRAALRECGMPAGGWWLYVFYDLADEPLYVGITSDVVSRFRSHRRTPFWPLAERWSLVYAGPFKGDALRRERVLHCTMRPRFNLAARRSPRSCG